MNTHKVKTENNKTQSVANSISQEQTIGDSMLQFVDNRPEAIMQKKQIEIAKNSRQAKNVAQQQRQFQPILQGVFIIGEPLDGSFYNRFSVADAVNFFESKNIASNAQLTEILTEIESPAQENFTWVTLEANIREHLLSDDEKSEIDDNAFDKALEAAGNLMHDDIEVDWQYQGNIAEATTRFIHDDSNLGISIMVDVNEEDDHPEYDQYDAETRLGQRITLFTHELTYHGNLAAQAREEDGTQDPDLDHRLMFSPESRTPLFTPFLRAVENEIAEVDPPTAELVNRLNGIISSWHSDMVFHIDTYGLNPEQKAEATEWANARRNELIAMIPAV